MFSTPTATPSSVSGADLDNDGDVDVLSSSFGNDKITWYENNGVGNPFSDEQVISTAADGADSISGADLDNDGDLDVLSASCYDNKIAWYENDGTGTFSPRRLISTAANGAQSVSSADLDNDGDLDVLSASQFDKIAWYETKPVNQSPVAQDDAITTNEDTVLTSSVLADNGNGATATRLMTP